MNILEYQFNYINLNFIYQLILY